MIKIYNTLTKQKEVFTPIKENEVGMYVCGPTTYNYFHIGNGRAFLFFDVVRSYFHFKGMKVKYVQNITDIEDKIISKAIAENLPIDAISKKYIKAFKDDIKALEIKRANRYPRATGYIDKMIGFISRLEKKGYAYNINGDVYFSVKKVSDYGKLSGKNIEQLTAGARVEENTQKKYSGDFVLWKKAKKGEPKWKSPWGWGRPGWHTECVVMSRDIFKATFDIHCGGIDLVFPHHENEIAQAEADTSQPLANYWMHNGFINIQGEKMSKSKGNFFMVRDILKTHSAETIRHFYLAKHYRSPIDFNDDELQASKSAVKKLYQPFKESFQTGSEAGNTILKSIPEYEQEFIAIMDDDFNTAKSIALLFDIVKSYYNAQSNTSKLQHFQTLKKIGNVLGFFQNLPSKLSGESGKGSNEFIELLIEYRKLFKQDKNYQYADMIRDDLKKKGVILQDKADGTDWYRENE